MHRTRYRKLITLAKYRHRVEQSAAPFFVAARAPEDFEEISPMGPGLEPDPEVTFELSHAEPEPHTTAPAMPVAPYPYRSDVEERYGV